MNNIVTEKMIEAMRGSLKGVAQLSYNEARKALEEALSTNDEPVGYMHEFRASINSNWFKDFSFHHIVENDYIRNINPVYSTPPQSMPSVAVKALEWERRESISRYSGMTGYYSILLLDDGQWKFSYGSPGKTVTFDVSKHPNRDEAEKSAQDIHDTMIRSALSAKVQDVAGWKAYEDVDRTASNAFDAEELDYPVTQQLEILRAIKRGILMERQRLAAAPTTNQKEQK